MKKYKYEIYDVITGDTILVDSSDKNTNVKNVGKRLNFSYTKICHLKSGKHNFIENRFVLKEKLEKYSFVLIDSITKEEFVCLSNKTLFLHLNIPYNDNEGKYIYELKKGRQYHASIGNRIFHCKGNEYKHGEYSKNFGDMKVKNESTQKFKQMQKKQMRIRGNLRTRISDLIRKNKTFKYKQMHDLLGCDKNYFIKYLESMFSDEMSWENYGTFWHVDHIIPMFTFDLFKEEDIRKCCHYTNLRPMKASDNLSRPMNMNFYVGKEIKDLMYPLDAAI